MFERILIPLDGSPRAELILGQIAPILRRKDADVLLLRVVEAGGAAPRMGTDFALDRERVRAHEDVHGLSARLAAQGLRVRGLVAEGTPAAVILELAEKERATLIAMTTHGRTGLARWFAGSVAEKVVRTSPVPVLLVRSFRASPLGDLQPMTAAQLPFKRILAPTDGSPAAAAVLEPAGLFAQLFDSRVLVLHAEPPVAIPAYGELGITPVLPPTPSEKDPVTEGAAERLRALGIPTARRTVVGDAAGVILDTSRTEGVDLIAMATHGRSGVSRWFLGSVAERVLRHADVPVLLVRADRAAPGSGNAAGKPENAAQPA